MAEKTIKQVVIEEILERFRDKIEFETTKDPIDYATAKIILMTSSDARKREDPFLLDISYFPRGGFYECIPCFKEGYPETDLKEIMSSLKEEYSKSLEYERRLLSDVSGSTRREEFYSGARKTYIFEIGKLEKKIEFLDKYLGIQRHCSEK